MPTNLVGCNHRMLISEMSGGKTLSQMEMDNHCPKLKIGVEILPRDLELVVLMVKYSSREMEIFMLILGVVVGAHFRRVGS